MCVAIRELRVLIVFHCILFAGETSNVVVAVVAVILGVVFVVVVVIILVMTIKYVHALLPNPLSPFSSPLSSPISSYLSFFS